MVIPLCPKTPADPILGTHNEACGYACLHGIACYTTISIIWHTKKFNLVKWGVELKMNWLNWSIPTSSGFQFQFNSNSKSFNSIPIQFMLNWIELNINSNSIHELIRALLTDDKSTLFQAMAWCRQATSHYLNQCWPRSMSPYGVTRPQWVKRVRHSPVWGMGRCLYTGCS